MQGVFLTIVLAPLVAAVAAGLFGRQIGRNGAHSVTILGVGVSFVLSLYVLKGFAFDDAVPFNASVYRWALVGSMVPGRLRSSCVTASSRS